MMKEFLEVLFVVVFLLGGCCIQSVVDLLF